MEYLDFNSDINLLPIPRYHVRWLDLSLFIYLFKFN
jgi:hypothetical protein